MLALLVLVPLVVFRSTPADEQLAVTVELARPRDLTDKVRLSWTASRDLDFTVVVSAEGEAPRALLAERNHSMTVEVEPGTKYCFTIQASDGDRVYESEPQPLRGATCGS